MTGLNTLRPHQQTVSMASVEPETWKPVVGYEGLYEVSDLGRVRSVDIWITSRNRWGTETCRLRKGRILKQTIDRGKEAYGRRQVKLSRENHPKTRLVHQLVAAAFIGPRPNGLEVAHRDGNAAHNALLNLRYSTPKDNSADKYTHGTMLCGTAVHNSKLRECDVLRIRALHGERTVSEIAEMFQISIAQVSRIQNGKRWAHVVGRRVA